MDQLAMEVGAIALEAALGLVGRSLVAGALAFFAGAALVVVLGRRGVFRREPVAWRWGAAVFYLYVPLVLGAAGAGGGALSGLSASLGQVVDARLAPAVRQQLPAVRTWLVEEVDFGAVPLGLDEATDAVLLRLRMEPAGHPARAWVFNHLVSRGGRALIRATLAVLAKEALGQSGVSRRTAGLTAQALRDADLSTLDEHAIRVIVSAAHDGVDALVHALASQLLLTLLLLLLPVPLERAVYWLAWERRRGAVSASPGSAGPVR